MVRYGILVVGKRGGSFLAPRTFKTRSQSRYAIKLSKKSPVYRKAGFVKYQSIKIK